LSHSDSFDDEGWPAEAALDIPSLSSMERISMKALIYNGPRDVSIKEVPDVYMQFGDRDEGWIKVILKPGG
jgi:threonine dehydrogenase-like Zn-dependent dehydrogenase